MSATLFLDAPRPWPCNACCQAETGRCPQRRRAFLLEWRGEVYARLAADLENRGVQVVRGRGAALATWRFGHCPSNLILVNLRQPDHEGWTLVEKIRRRRPTALLWAYDAALVPGDRIFADALQVDELIEYGGDLFRLCDAVVARLGALPAHLPRRRETKAHRHAAGAAIPLETAFAHQKTQR